MPTDRVPVSVRFGMVEEVIGTVEVTYGQDGRADFRTEFAKLLRAAADRIEQEGPEE